MRIAAFDPYPFVLLQMSHAGLVTAGRRSTIVREAGREACAAIAAVPSAHPGTARMPWRSPASGALSSAALIWRRGLRRRER